MKPKVGDLSIPAVDAARGAHSGLAATGVLEQLPYFPAATRGALRQLALRCMSDEGKRPINLQLPLSLELCSESELRLVDFSDRSLQQYPSVSATTSSYCVGTTLRW